MSLPPRLVALSPGTLGRPDGATLERFEAQLAAALEAGLLGLVLREKFLDDRPYLELWTRIARRVAARSQAFWLALHDRAHLAALLGPDALRPVDALHLADASLPPAALAPWRPKGLTVGRSVHAKDDPLAFGDVDYVFLAPVFETAKRPARDPLGLPAFARAARASPVGVWALGGVDPSRVAPCLSAGARGVCVQSGLFGADAKAAPTQVASRVRDYLDALQGFDARARPGAAD